MNEGADFLPVASHLGAPPPGIPAEAALRSSYGRSYYAAFTVAGAALEKAGIRLSRGADRHDEVPKWLKASRSEDVVECGSVLLQLRRMRNSCDYEMKAAVTVVDAAKGYQLAKRVIDDLRKAQGADMRLGISR